MMMLMMMTRTKMMITTTTTMMMMVLMMMLYLPEPLKPSSVSGGVFGTSNLEHIGWDEPDLK